jgi:predicted Zn finger-like uncharacterized protein
MPTVYCPTCQAKINAPENKIGQQVRCPKCKNPFVAQASGSASGFAPAALPVAAADPFAFDEPAAPPPPGVVGAPVATAAPAADDPLSFDELPAVAEGPAPVVAAKPDKARRAVHRPAHPRAVGGGGGAVEVFLFEAYLAPFLVHVLFWAGSAFAIYTGITHFQAAGQIAEMQSQLVAMTGKSLPGGGTTALYVQGVAWIVLGPVFFRLIGELCMLAYRNRESLDALREEARRHGL